MSDDIIIDIPGINPDVCKTEKADYVVYFYPRDHHRKKVVREVREEGYTVVDTEYEEEGELEVLFVEEQEKSV